MWKEKWNSISTQNKGMIDSITSKEWNFIINVLKEQANNNTEGLISSNTIIKKLEDQNKLMMELFRKDEFYTKSETDEIVELLTNISLGEFDLFKVSVEEPTNPYVTLWYQIEED